MTTNLEDVLRATVSELLSLENPSAKILSMKYTAVNDKSAGENYVHYLILVALAKEIGTNDPLADSNLLGVCENREKLKRALTAYL